MEEDGGRLGPELLEVDRAAARAVDGDARAPAVELHVDVPVAGGGAVVGAAAVDTAVLEEVVEVVMVEVEVVMVTAMVVVSR